MSSTTEREDWDLHRQVAALFPASSTARCLSIDRKRVRSIPFLRPTPNRARRPVGLYRCDSHWLCPHCSSLMMSASVSILTPAVVEATEKAGRSAFLLTLTLKVDADWVGGLKMLMGARNRFVKDKVWTALTTASGGRWISAIELSAPREARSAKSRRAREYVRLFPHVHFLILADWRTSRHALKMKRREIFKRWARVAARLGGDTSNRAISLVHAKDPEAALKYLLKGPFDYASGGLRRLLRERSSVAASVARSPGVRNQARLKAIDAALRAYETATHGKWLVGSCDGTQESVKRVKMQILPKRVQNSTLKAKARAWCRNALFGRSRKVPASVYRRHRNDFEVWRLQ